MTNFSFTVRLVGLQHHLMILAASEVKLVLLIRRSWVIRDYGVHLWHLMVVCVHLVTGVVLTMGLVRPT